MRRLYSLLAIAASVAAFAPAANGEPPIVSNLHTVSIHVDNIESFNAMLRLLSEDFQWPIIFGKPLTADRKDRRNYAGIWAGNVRFEICGPYSPEFQPQDSGARLHGLTFRPRETAEQSALELDRLEIRHKPIVTWGSAASPLKFVIFEDPGMLAPLFAISLMDETKQPADQGDRALAHPAFMANHGGPLGLKQVREVHVNYSGVDALSKWKRLLGTDTELWPGGTGPALRFIKHATNGVSAAVLEVISLDEAARRLKELGFPVSRSAHQFECTLHGVRLLFAE